MAKRRQTALGLVLRYQAQEEPLPPPATPKPKVNGDFLVLPGINPHRQSKHNGELPRRRGRKG